MLPGIITGWPSPVCLRHLAPARAEGPRGSLAMHIKPLVFSIHPVSFDLGHVVGHVIDQIEL